MTDRKVVERVALQVRTESVSSLNNVLKVIGTVLKEDKSLMKQFGIGAHDLESEHWRTFIGTHLYSILCDWARARDSPLTDSTDEIREGIAEELGVELD